MELFWLFVKITLYPVAAIVICGLMVWACTFLFARLLGNGGHTAMLAASIIGTPIHELGHAAMCLLFGHRIEKLVLWQPRSAEGRLGYVQHTYNSRKLYHRLGNLFIGTGPIFSGMAVLSLLLFLTFPNTWNTYVSSVRSLVEHSASVPEILAAGLQMLPNMIAEFGNGSISVWVRILVVLAMLSVSLHINLSPSDIKGALNALPPYLLITLLATAVTLLLGPAATELVLEALAVFHTFMMAMFTMVLTFAAAQAALALVLHFLLTPFRR